MAINKLTFDTDKKTVSIGGLTPVFNSFIGFTGASISGAPSGNPILGVSSSDFSREGSLLISQSGLSGFTALNEVYYNKNTDCLVFEGYSLEVTGEAGASAHIGGNTFQLPERYVYEESQSGAGVSRHRIKYGNHDCSQPIQLRPGEYQALQSFRGKGSQSGAIILQSTLAPFDGITTNPPSGFGRLWSAGHFAGRRRSFTKECHPTSIGFNYLSVLSVVLLPNGSPTVFFGGTAEIALGCNSNLTGAFCPATPLPTQRFRVHEPISGLESTSFNFSGTGESGFGLLTIGGGSGGTAGRTGEGISAGFLLSGYSGSSYNSALALQAKLSVSSKPGKRSFFGYNDYADSLMAQTFSSPGVSFAANYLHDVYNLEAGDWEALYEAGNTATESQIVGLFSTTGGYRYSGPTTGYPGGMDVGVAGSSVDGFFAGLNYSGIYQGTIRSNISYDSLTADFHFDDLTGQAFSGICGGIQGVNSAQASISNVLPNVVSMITNRATRDYCKSGGYLWTWFDFQSHSYFVEVDGVQCLAYSLLYYPTNNYQNNDEREFGGAFDKRAFSHSGVKSVKNTKSLTLNSPRNLPSFNEESIPTMYSWHYDMKKMVDYSDGMTLDFDTVTRFKTGDIFAGASAGDRSPHDFLSPQLSRYVHGLVSHPLGPGGPSSLGYPWNGEDLIGILGENTPIFLVRYKEGEEQPS